MSRGTLAIVGAIGGVLVLALVARTPVHTTIQRWLVVNNDASAPSPESSAPMPTMSNQSTPPGTARGEVMLDTRRQQLIGVRTTPVVRGSITDDVRVVGIVQFDETRQAEINTRVDGWIRELFADYAGKPIR